MATTLGSLILELGLDDGKFKDQLRVAKQNALLAGKDIEGNLKGINASKLNLHLEPTVNDEALTALNKHLELKRKHFQSVQGYFRANPLTVKADSSDLDAATDKFDILQRKKLEKKELQYSDGKIVIDQSDLDEALAKIKQLNYELDSLSRGVTIPTRVAQEVITPPESEVRRVVRKETAESPYRQVADPWVESTRSRSSLSESRGLSDRSSEDLQNDIYQGTKKGTYEAMKSFKRTDQAVTNSQPTVQSTSQSVGGYLIDRTAHALLENTVGKVIDMAVEEGLIQILKASSAAMRAMINANPVLKIMGVDKVLGREITSAYMKKAPMADKTFSEQGKRRGGFTGFFNEVKNLATVPARIVTTPARNAIQGFFEGVGGAYGEAFADGAMTAQEKKTGKSVQQVGEDVAGTAVGGILSGVKPVGDLVSRLGSVSRIEEGAKPVLEAYGIDTTGKGLDIKVLDQIADFTTRLGGIVGKSLDPAKAQADVESIKKSLMELGVAIATLDNIAGKGLAVGTTVTQASQYPKQAVIDQYKKTAKESALDLDSRMTSPATVPKELKDGTKRVMFVSAGFAGKQGMQGHNIAEQIRPLVPETTEVIPFENREFDVNASEVGPESSMGDLAQWGSEVMGNMLKILELGYNPAAVRMATEAYAYSQQNPDVGIDLVGHSAGGMIAREAQAILAQMGVKSNVLSMATPFAGVVDPQTANAASIMGEGDPLGMPYVPLSPGQALTEGVAGHNFDAYAANENVNQMIETFSRTGVSPELLEQLEATQVKAVEGGAQLNNAVVQLIDNLTETVFNSAGYLAPKQAREKIQSRIKEKSAQLKADAEAGLIPYQAERAMKGFKTSETVGNPIHPITGQPLNRAQTKLSQDEAEQITLFVGGLGGSLGLESEQIGTELAAMLPDHLVVAVETPENEVLPAEGETVSSPSFLQKAIATIAKDLNFEGDSAAAERLAERAYQYHLQNPDKPINLVGQSGGGMLTRHAADILGQMGVPDVRVANAATPGFGGADTQGITLVSTDDPLAKNVGGLMPNQVRVDSKGHSRYFANRSDEPDTIDNFNRRLAGESEVEVNQSTKAVLDTYFDRSLTEEEARTAVVNARPVFDPPKPIREQVQDIQQDVQKKAEEALAMPGLKFDEAQNAIKDITARLQLTEQDWQSLNDAIAPLTDKLKELEAFYDRMMHGDMPAQVEVTPTQETRPPPDQELRGVPIPDNAPEVELSSLPLEKSRKIMAARTAAMMGEVKSTIDTFNPEDFGNASDIAKYQLAQAKKALDSIANIDLAGELSAADGDKVRKAVAPMQAFLNRAGKDLGPDTNQFAAMSDMDLTRFIEEAAYNIREVDPEALKKQLAQLTKAQLLTVAKKSRKKGYSALNKESLVEFLAIGGNRELGKVESLAEEQKLLTDFKNAEKAARKAVDAVDPPSQEVYGKIREEIYQLINSINMAMETRVRSGDVRQNIGGVKGRLEQLLNKTLKTVNPTDINAAREKLAGAIDINPPSVDIPENVDETPEKKSGLDDTGLARIDPSNLFQNGSQAIQKNVNAAIKAVTDRVSLAGFRVGESVLNNFDTITSGSTPLGSAVKTVIKETRTDDIDKGLADLSDELNVIAQQFIVDLTEGVSDLDTSEASKSGVDAMKTARTALEKAMPVLNKSLKDSVSRLSKSKQDVLKDVSQKIKTGDTENISEELRQEFDDIITTLKKDMGDSIRSIDLPELDFLDESIRKNRHIALERKAVPLVEKRTAELLDPNHRDPVEWTTNKKGEQKEDLWNKNKRGNAKKALEATPDAKELFIVTGGYGGAEGKSGRRLVAEIGDKLDKKYQTVISVDNKASDIPAEAKDDAKLRREAINKSLAKANLVGYSEDAIEMAAQAAAAVKLNPEIKIKLIGESGGGFIAEEAAEILKKMGIAAEYIAVGTPDLIGALNERKDESVISKDDGLQVSLEKELGGLGILRRGKNTTTRGAKDHVLPSYSDQGTAELEHFISPMKFDSVDSINDLMQSIKASLDDAEASLATVDVGEALDLSDSGFYNELDSISEDIMMNLQLAKRAALATTGEISQQFSDLADQLDTQYIKAAGQTRGSLEVETALNAVQSFLSKNADSPDLAEKIPDQKAVVDQSLRAIDEYIASGDVGGTEKEYLGTLRNKALALNAYMDPSIPKAEDLGATPEGSVNLSDSIKAMMSGVDVDPRDIVSLFTVELQKSIETMREVVMVKIKVLFEELRSQITQSFGGNGDFDLDQGLARSSGKKNPLDLAKQKLKEYQKRIELTTESIFTKATQVDNSFIGQGVRDTAGDLIDRGQVAATGKGRLDDAKFPDMKTGVFEKSKNVFFGLRDSFTNLFIGSQAAIEVATTEINKVQQTYDAIAQEVATLSNVQLNVADIPELVVDDRMLQEIGADAFYDIQKNQVIITKETEQLLANAESLGEYSEHLKDVIHELRHATQLEFGKRSLSQISSRSQDFATPDMGRVTDPTQLASVEASVDVVRQRAASAGYEVSDRDIEVVRTAEEDAYAFEANAADILSNVSSKVTGNVKANVDLANTNLREGMDQLLATADMVFPGISDSVKGAIDTIEQFGTAGATAIQAFISWKILSWIVPQLASLATASLDTARQFQQMEVAMGSALGGSSAAATGFAFVRSEVQRLNTDIIAATQSYIALSASTQGTELQGAATDQIFSATEQAISANQLDPQEAERVGMAVQQIASKGVVSSEELRQQLSESLPGAFQIAARSMGMTVVEFNKMLETGSILSEDFLPRFAQQLSAETANGVAGAANSAQGAMNNFNNEMLMTQAALGRPLLDPQKMGFNLLAKALEVIQTNGAFVTQVILLFTATLAGAFLNAMYAAVAAALAFLGKLGLIPPALATIKGALGAVMGTLKAFAMQMLVFYAASEVLEIFAKAFNMGKTEIRDFANTAESSMDTYIQALERARNANDDFTASLPSSNKDVKGQSFLEDFIIGDAVKFVLPDDMDEQVNGFFRGAEKYMTKIPNPLTMASAGVNYARNGEFRAPTFSEASANAQKLNRDDLIAQANKTSQEAYKQIGADGDGILELGKVRDIDKKLEDTQARRRGLLPQDTEARKRLDDEISTLLKERDVASKPIGILQQKLVAEKQALEQMLTELDDKAKSGNISQEDYESQYAGTQSALDANVKAQEKLNSLVRQSIDRAQLLAWAFEDVNAAIAEGNRAMEMQIAQQNRALATATLERGTLNVGATEGTAAIAMQEQLGMRIEQNRKNAQMLMSELTGGEVSRALELSGIQEQGDITKVSPEYLTARANRMSDGQEKTVLLDAAEQYKQVLDMTLESENLLTQVEESKVQLQSQIDQMGQELTRLFEDLEIQTQEIELATKQLVNDRDFANASSIITRSMSRFRGTYFSGFMDGLSEFVDVLNREMQQTTDYLKEKLSIMQQALQNTRQTTDLANQVPGVDGSVTGGNLGGTKGAGTLVGVVGNTGSSTGSHLDIRYSRQYAQSSGRMTADGNRARVSDEHLARLAANGTPLSDLDDRITSEHGWRNHPTRGGRRHHDGIDFGLATGTKLTSTVAIESVGQPTWDPGGGGWMTTVRFSDGVELMLLHQDPSVQNAGLGTGGAPVQQPQARPQQSSAQQSSAQQFQGLANTASQVRGPSGGINTQGLTVKGQQITDGQLQNARVIARVGQQLGATADEIRVAIATAIQESTLRNLAGGDRDSGGLFQQRPSQSWGSYDQVTNPEQAARSFFQGISTNPGLLDVRGRSDDLYRRSHMVQRSAHPDAPRQWDAEARRLAQAAIAANSGSTTPALPGAMTGGGGNIAGPQPQAPSYSAADVSQVTQQTTALQGQIAGISNQQTANTNQLLANLNSRRDLEQFVNDTQVQGIFQKINNNLLQTQRDASIRSQVTMPRQQAQQAFDAIDQPTETQRLENQIAMNEFDTQEQKITLEYDLREIQNDISEAESLKQSLPTMLQAMGATPQQIQDMTTMLDGFITASQSLVPGMQEALNNVETHGAALSAKFRAESQRVQEEFSRTRLETATQDDVSLLRTQAEQASLNNRPQEAEQLNYQADNLETIVNARLERERFLVDFDAGQFGDKDSAEAIAFRDERLRDIDARTEVAIANIQKLADQSIIELEQYIGNAVSASGRELRSMEIQSLRFNGDPMQALQMEQTDSLQATLEEFENRRIEIIFDPKLDDAAERQMLADLDEIEAMTLDMVAKLDVRAQVQLDMSNIAAELEGRVTNLQALIPNLLASGEQGNARDMQAELDGLNIQQELQERLFAIDDPDNGLTADVRERLKLLAEETAVLQAQNLEREHALNIQRDQNEIARNTITNPGGPQALAAVQDDYLSMYGITPTYAMDQERLPMQLELQQINYQDQLVALEELRNSGKLTQEAYEKAGQALAAMNEIKLDKLRVEASGIPEVVNAVKGPVQGLFKDILDGSKSAGEIFQSFVDGILDNLINLASEWLTNSLFNSFLGGGAGSPGQGGGLFGSLFAPPEAVDPMAPTTGIGGVIGLADSVWPGTADAMTTADPGTSLVTGANQAGQLVAQSGQVFLQYAQQAGMALQQASFGTSGGPMEFGSSAFSFLGGGGSKAATAANRGFSIDPGPLNLSFDRGARSLGDAITRSSNTGASTFGSAIGGLFGGGGALGGATKGGGGIGSMLGGLLGGGGSGGGFGGILGSLLPSLFGLLGFSEGGDVATGGYRIPNFSAGGPLQGISNEAVKKAYDKEKPHGKPVLAMLNSSEWVLNKKQQAIAAQYGVTPQLLGFAGGGAVGPTIRPMVNTSNVGGSTSVNVPVTVNSSGGNKEDDAKSANQLAQKVRSAVYEVIQKEQRFNGLLGR
jgi:tape measure domain-containing protein